MGRFQSWVYTDPWGAPKEKDLLFRWTLPDFTYAFDASFVNYFGSEGIEAVHDAVNVINDFFENGDYSGMSQLDLHKHGFAKNYNTSWVNTTAQNGQILDIKSMVLGTMVNFLGLGNPHQHMWTISTIHAAPTPDPKDHPYNNAYWKIGANLRNYDPLSYQPTHRINDVDYSYRLISNTTNLTQGRQSHRLDGRTAGGIQYEDNGIEENYLKLYSHDNNPRVFNYYLNKGQLDLEEFTTSQDGNAWSSVAAINSAFYGFSSRESWSAGHRLPVENGTFRNDAYRYPLTLQFWGLLRWAERNGRPI